MNPILHFYRELVTPPSIACSLFQFKKEDQLYVQGVNLLKDAPMTRFGVRRKFFLNKQSIQDEISLHKVDSVQQEAYSISNLH